MGEKEERLRAALAGIAEHARQLRAAFLSNAANLAFVRDLLSPDGNDACVKMGRLAKCLLEFPPGGIPHPWLTEWHTESMRLVEAIRERYPEVSSLHHTWNAQKSLYDLLTARYEEFDDPAAFKAEIKVKLRCLKMKYRENSNGFNELLVQERRRGVRDVAAPTSRTRTADPEVARRREEDRRILEVVCAEYRKRRDCGRKDSYLAIVRRLMTGGTYAARMKGKKAETWANQASAYGKRGKDSVGTIPADSLPRSTVPNGMTGLLD